MTFKSYKYIHFTSKVIALFVLGNACFADEIRAFSLREAERQLQQGFNAADGHLQTLGGITRFAGMVFDRETRDIILVGKARRDLPLASLDDLVVALRARLVNKQSPKVSIDMTEETPRTGMQDVRLAGGIADTKFGEDFFLSDVVLKRYSLDLVQQVEGLSPYLKLYEDTTKAELQEQGHTIQQVTWLSEEESKQAIDSYVGQMASESQTIQSRFWFYVMEEESFIVERDDVFVIKELRLGVKEETLTNERVDSNGTLKPESEDGIGTAFAQQFTEHYTEASTTYPVLKRLKVLFDLVAIAEGISHLDKDPSMLDFLLSSYSVNSVDTPENYRLVQRVGEFQTEDDVSAIVQLSGGIELEAILLALEDGDVSALREAVLRSRPSQEALFWIIPLDGWKMPNDKTDTEEKQQQLLSAPGTINLNRLGMAINAQRFVFDPALQSEATPEFKGFLPPSAIEAFNLPISGLGADPSFSGDPGGVVIAPPITDSELGGDDVLRRVLQSRPSRDRLSWPVESR